jgi:putative hemolysin
MEDQSGEQIRLLLASSVVVQESPYIVIFGSLLLLCLVIISGLISGSEIAFFSLHTARVNALKGKSAEAIRWLWTKPEKLLATILIYNNLVNISIIILAVWLSKYLFHFRAEWMLFLVNGVAITALILLFCELLPKIIANQKPVTLARIMADPLRIGMVLIYPVVMILVKSTLFIDKRMKRKGVDFSRQDLNEAINYSTKIAEGDVEEAKLLKGIISFGDKEVTEIMTSRMDVVGIDEQEPFSSVLQIIRRSGFSRYPVYQENIDKITGVLHIKDMLPFLDSDENVRWQEKIRPVYVIPENKKIKDLLKEFQQKKKHMAVVVDEFGGANGIITLEDVIEEIVGDISDEFDDEDDFIDYRNLGENLYEFEGKVLIHDFLKILDIADEYGSMAKGEADTLAGFLLEMKGDIPVMNEKLTYETLVFTIKEVDRRRIKRIQIEYKPNG